MTTKYELFGATDEALAGDSFTKDAPDLLLQAAWAINRADGYEQKVQEDQSITDSDEGDDDE